MTKRGGLWLTFTPIVSKMKSPKKNRLNSVLAMLLLCTMGLKMCVALMSHFNTGAESFAIEKNSEEGKDIKEENFSKAQKKLIIEGRTMVDHIAYQCISHVKPVCRYKMRTVINPPKTVPTPPPNFA